MCARLKSGSDLSIQADHRGRGNPQLDGCLGEQIIFEAKVLLDEDATLDELQQCLDTIQYGPSLSKQERYIKFQGQSIFARALRNKGKFTEACLNYQELLQHHKQGDHTLSNDAIASYAEVLCEMSNPQGAFNILRDEQTLRLTSPGSRIQIALGYTHLTTALLLFLKTRRGIDYLQTREAECIFARYKASRSSQDIADLTTTMKYHYYIACAGHAMVCHWESFEPDFGEPRSDLLTKAISLWEMTGKYARNCWPKPGFAELIVTLSLCELKGRLGYAGTEELLNTERQLEAEIGRQYQFTAQGTFWWDILDYRLPTKLQDLE